MSKLRLISAKSTQSAKLSDDNLRSLSEITANDVPEFWRDIKHEEKVKVNIAASIQAIAKKALTVK